MGSVRFPLRFATSWSYIYRREVLYVLDLLFYFRLLALIANRCGEDLICPICTSVRTLREGQSTITGDTNH